MTEGSTDDAPTVPGIVGLADAIEALRAELQEAHKKSEGQSVRFRLADVTLTVEVVASREGTVGGKVRWWVVEAGGEAKASRESTQTLVLNLTPGLYDKDGKPAPLEVVGDQAEPGNGDDR